jgi:hypothetical protein
VLLRAKVIDEETSVKPPRNYPTPGVHPLAQGWFHLTPIHTILLERFGVFPGKAYMLEIAAIVFIVITVPLWFPLVISVLSFMVALVIRLLSFGFMMVFWLVLIAVVIFLLLT